MDADNGSTDADFVRFMGARTVDADSDERNCTVVNGKGVETMGLRTNASLLAVANQYGAIFVGAATGFRWALLADLRAASVAGTTSEAAAAALHEGASSTAPPFYLSINADEGFNFWIV